MRSQNDVFSGFFFFFFGVWLKVKEQLCYSTPRNGKMGIWCPEPERLMLAFELMAGICTCVNHKGLGSSHRLLSKAKTFGVAAELKI